MKTHDDELLYAVKRINETLDRILYLLEKKEIKERNIILKNKTRYIPTLEGNDNEDS